MTRYLLATAETYSANKYEHNEYINQIFSLSQRLVRGDMESPKKTLRNNVLSSIHNNSQNNEFRYPYSAPLSASIDSITDNVRVKGIPMHSDDIVLYPLRPYTIPIIHFIYYLIDLQAVLSLHFWMDISSQCFGSTFDDICTLNNNRNQRFYLFHSG